MKKSRQVPPAYQSYREQTLRPLNSLIFIAPLLVAFHIGAAKFGTDLLVVDYLDRILRYFFGTAGTHLPPALIVAVLLAQHFLRRDRWRIEPRVLTGMLAESILWTLPVIALTFLLQRAPVQAAAAADVQPGLLQQITGYLGAGIYEEFFFRLVLISIILLVFVDLCSLPKRIVRPVAVIVVAAVFSFCHRPEDLLSAGSPPYWNYYVFLFLAGLLWGLVFVFRGLGIAVGSHIFYNLYKLGVAQ